MSDITAFCSADTPLHRLLEKHPHVKEIQPAEEAPLEFEQNGWRRKIWGGRPDVETSGLVELMDNNPIVCADEISVPSAGATLALIALGPLIRAGLMVESPTLQLSCSGDEAEIEAFLRGFGWGEGATTQFETVDLGQACACVAMANIQNLEDWSDIDTLYEETYGRCFYVNRAEDGNWDSERVVGKPGALFRLRLTPGEPTSLLTIQAMADRDGKCGAAQIVHAMNMMAGFEETLGID